PSVLTTRLPPGVLSVMRRVLYDFFRAFRVCRAFRGVLESRAQVDERPAAVRVRPPSRLRRFRLRWSFGGPPSPWRRLVGEPRRSSLRFQVSGGRQEEKRFDVPQLTHIASAALRAENEERV